jgi:hypothetical protein
VIPVKEAGVYGMIKQVEIPSRLPVDQQEEFDQLDRCKHRITEVEKRIEELWDLAIELHRQRREPEDWDIEAAKTKL